MGFCAEISRVGICCPCFFSCFLLRFLNSTMNPLDNILVGVPEVMRSVVVNMGFDFSANVLAERCCVQRVQ